MVSKKMDYREVYDNWLESRYISEEDKDVLRGMNEYDIHEAFYRTLEFGTGGMRGVMGLGTNRLNIYTIRMAAKAMADMLIASQSQGKATGFIDKIRSAFGAGTESGDNLKMPSDKTKYDSLPKIVIAYDTRNGSKAFARETAKVFAEAGVIAYLFDRPSPVPLLSFAVRELKAGGGVVITASHNTKEYNGFKAYDNTGCQMLPDKTEKIAEHMAKFEDPLAIDTMNIDDAIIDAKLTVPIGEEIISKFLDAIETCGLPKSEESLKDDEIQIEKFNNSRLKTVYTPLHGSGRDYVMNSLQRAGFCDLKLVESQATFDGDFPTVMKPNPEDRAALDIAVKEACDLGADIVIGTDPDCDRVGVALINRDVEAGDDVATFLTGNEVGVLLIDYLCSIGNSVKSRRLITTIVTSAMGPIIAKDHDINVSFVLTGFKYIGDIMNAMEDDASGDEFFMGYEESYGYLTGTHARDKDGVSSALTICRMAAYHKSMGKTLADRLAELYAEYGYWLDEQESFVFEGSEGEQTMAAIMAEFREQKEKIFEGFCEEKSMQVRYGDFLSEGSGLPKADVLKYIFDDGSWIAVRPSGTEPKIKVYYCIYGADPEESSDKGHSFAQCIHQLTDRF